MISIRSRWPRGLSRRSWLLSCWDRGFEFRSGYGCLSCIYVVFCVDRGLRDELITPSYHVPNKIKEGKKGSKGPVLAVKTTDDDD
jgi:hypothetical protein